MIDSHVHLQDVSDDTRESLLRCFDAQKFSTVFCNATSPADWDSVMSMADEIRIVPFIGVHPWFVDTLPPDWHEQLITRLDKYHCGIGEIGLDKGPKGVHFEKQIDVFSRQIDTAILLKRPFVLHCVNAWGPLMNVLRMRPLLLGVPFIVHSFIGSHEILNDLLQMGALISIGERSVNQKDAVGIITGIPSDRLLLETDFPYLPGKEKDHVDVRDYVQSIDMIYQQTAQIRGLSVDALTRQVSENAQGIMRYIVNGPHPV